MARYLKDPNASLVYGWDWSKWLAAEDAIDSSEWEVPEGLTLVAEGTTNKTSTWVRLSGGDNGKKYRVVNHITTIAGDEDDRSFIIDCRNR